MLAIEKRLIKTKNFFPTRFNFKVNSIVLHSTAGFFEGSISWLSNPKSMASVHYIISSKGKIVQLLDEKYGCFGAGVMTATKDKLPKAIKDNGFANPNFYTIQIELEDERQGGDRVYPQAQYNALLLLVKDIVKRYGIRIHPDYIMTHSAIDPVNRFDPVGHWDHAKFLKDLGFVKEFSLEGGDIKKFYLKPRQLTIKAPLGLNIRKEPNTSSIKLGYIAFKAPAQVEGFVVSEEVTINGIRTSMWWKLKNVDGYVWAGGTDNIPEIEVANMTRAEIDTKLNELNTRKAQLAEELNTLEAELATYTSTKSDEDVAEEQRLSEVEQLKARLKELGVSGTVEL